MEESSKSKQKISNRRPQEILDYVNLQTIDYYVKLGILDPAETITVKTLVDAGIVKKCRFGVKILARVLRFVT